MQSSRNKQLLQRTIFVTLRIKMIDIFIIKFCRLIKKCGVTDKKIFLSDLDDLSAVVNNIKSNLDDGVICSNRENVAILRSSGFN